MQTLSSQNFKGLSVLVRVDFNVPLSENMRVTDLTRIKSSIPTIKKLISDGAKVVLISHLGRPKSKSDEFSLKHILVDLNRLLGTKVLFANDCFGNVVNEKISGMRNGEVLLLENLRFYKEEEMGDEVFAEKLSLLTDAYVNDAFGTSHRNHASTAVISKFFPKNKYCGFLLEKEISFLDNALNFSGGPKTAIIGGAKVSSKISVIMSLIECVDNLIVAGGMCYTFIKAMGGKIGDSLVEDDRVEEVKRIVEKAKKLNVNLLLPVDSVNGDSFSNSAKINTSKIDSIPEGYIGLDIGDESIKLFCKVIKASKMIIWNGPMGVFEMSSFEKGTKSISQAVYDCTNNGGFSLVGGGDSVAAIKKFGIKEGVSYISTGGGAMLKYLEGKDLPGIKALD